MSENGRLHLDESDLSDYASENDERRHITVPGWPGDPTYRWGGLYELNEVDPLTLERVWSQPLTLAWFQAFAFKIQLVCRYVLETERRLSGRARAQRRRWPGGRLAQGDGGDEAVCAQGGAAEGGVLGVGGGVYTKC